MYVYILYMYICMYTHICIHLIIAHGILAGNIPTHPVLVQWGMGFRCCLLHPTAMFRKKTVTDCGGYLNTMKKNILGNVNGKNIHRDFPENVPENVSENVIEDYSLWIRILERYPCSITNLPDVLIHTYIYIYIYIYRYPCSIANLPDVLIHTYIYIYIYIYRYPCSIANLPDVLIQLRLHDDSKSAREVCICISFKYYIYVYMHIFLILYICMYIYVHIHLHIYHKYIYMKSSLSVLFIKHIIINRFLNLRKLQIL
jgi:hypothetical protein